MTQISKEEIEKLAALARINLNEKELESFHKDIASILDFVSQVQSVSGTQEQERTFAGVWTAIKNKFREDKNPHDGGQFSEDILNAAPQSEGNYIRVKKIL